MTQENDSPLTETCSCCGEGQAAIRIESEPMTYRGQTQEVPFQLHTCDYCGSDYADAADVRANRVAIDTFRARIGTQMSEQP